MPKGIKGFQKGNSLYKKRTHWSLKSNREDIIRKLSELNEGQTAWNKGNLAYSFNCLFCGKLNKTSYKNKKYCSHYCASKGNRFGKKGHPAWNKGHGLGKNYKAISKRINGKKVLISHLVWLENNPNDKIKHNEVIHHVDGNPRNNRIENLNKMLRSNHVKFHMELLKNKIIKR